MKQTEKILPISAWKSVVIKECNEEMMDMSCEIRCVTAGKFAAISDHRVRKTVGAMLRKAQDYLGIEYMLGLEEGYRSAEKQKILWDQAVQEMKKLYPRESDQEHERFAGLMVAKPNPLANHHCGGAIDVTLLDKTGRELDMGTEIKSTDKESSPMFSNKLTAAQINNRTILREAMVKAGFVFYPGEWWHYCYGDRMWAVYTNKTECFYGPIDLE